MAAAESARKVIIVLYLIALHGAIVYFALDKYVFGPMIQKDWSPSAVTAPSVAPMVTPAVIPSLDPPRDKDSLLFELEDLGNLFEGGERFEFVRLGLDHPAHRHPMN